MRKSKLDAVREEVLKMYFVDEKSTEAIAHMFGLTDQSVINWLRTNSDNALRHPGPVKTKITDHDEVLMEHEDLDKFTDKDSVTNRGKSENGEIFDDLCKDILEQLQNNKISKQEAQLKWMFLKDEFEELGQLDFDEKYKDKVFNTNG
jgi:transposase